MCARSACQETVVSVSTLLLLTGGGKLRLLKMVIAVTRQNQDAADKERVNGITDLVEAQEAF